MNPLTGRGLRLEAARPWIRVIQWEALLALEIGLGFEFDLPAGAAKTFEVRLSDFTASAV